MCSTARIELYIEVRFREIVRQVSGMPTERHEHIRKRVRRRVGGICEEDEGRVIGRNDFRAEL